MIPDNFTYIHWNDTLIGQTVYVMSYHKDQLYICGTDGNYRVANKEKRLIRNGNSRFTFHIPDEFLLIKHLHQLK